MPNKPEKNGQFPGAEGKGNPPQGMPELTEKRRSH